MLVGAIVLLVIALFFLLKKHDEDGFPNNERDQGSDELAQMMGQEADPDTSLYDATNEAIDIITIRGQVILSNGEPASGAIVQAQASQVNDIFETVAGEGGLFSFETMPLALYAVEASAEGYGPAIAIGVVPGGAQLRLVLENGQDINGLISYREEPVANAVLHLGGPGVFPQRTVISDGAGRFRISGLRPGHYEYAVTATGLGSGFTGILSIDDVISESGLLDISLQRSPEITLRVVDAHSGAPIEGGVVTLSENPLYVLTLGRTIEYGVGLVDFLPRGHYWMRVRAPGYLPYEHEFDVDAVDEEVRIELNQGASLRGRVVDEAGNGVANVSLAAIIETEEGGRWELRRSLFDDFHRLVRPDGTLFWPPTMGFSSNQNGEFVVNGLPNGHGRLVARAEGFAPAVSSALDTRENQIVDNIELLLRRGRIVRGRVEDEEGGTVSNATLSLREQRIPAWSLGDSVITDGSGAFLLDECPEEMVLTVRHPDFTTISLNLSVPPEGIDDFIIRLSGEQLPEMSGRVFSTRGSSAVGSSVWLMHGEGELPVCRATVGNDAWFHASHCSAAPERLIISHPEHAPLIADLAGNTEPKDWRLMRGGEIEVVSQRTPVVVTINPMITLPHALWPRPAFEMERWGHEFVRLVAPGDYLVTCRAEGLADGDIVVSVREDERVQALCPFMRRIIDARVFILDPQGAPVNQAFVIIDGGVEPYRGVTGEGGYVDVETLPNRRLHIEAMHDQWGRGQEVETVRVNDTDPIRVELGQSIAGNDPETFLDQLDDWGISAVTDRRSVVLESVHENSPAAGIGLRRHDRLLWARPVSDFRFSVGIQRNDRVEVFELVRESEINEQSPRK